MYVSRSSQQLQKSSRINSTESPTTWRLLHNISEELYVCCNMQYDCPAVKRVTTMPREYVKCKSEIIKKTNHPLRVSEIPINRPLTRPHTFTPSPYYLSSLTTSTVTASKLGLLQHVTKLHVQKYYRIWCISKTKKCIIIIWN